MQKEGLRSLTFTESRKQIRYFNWMIIGSAVAWFLMLLWFGQGSPRPWIQENLILNAVLGSLIINGMLFLLLGSAFAASSQMCLWCGKVRHRERIATLKGEFQNRIPTGHCPTCGHNIAEDITGS